MSDPLLVFYCIFDNSLKFVLVELLLKKESLMFEDFLLQTGKDKRTIQTMLWDLQNHKIIQRIIRDNKNYYELTELGRSINVIEQEIELWERHF